MKDSRSEFKVLILGSTPELRDLCAKHKTNPYVIDYSAANYAAMGTLRRYTNNKEIFINQNWLNMNIETQFDVIFSEAAFNVVNVKMINCLLQKIHLHLKPTGVLLAKTWIRRNNHYENIDDLISYFRLKMENHDFYSALCLPLMIHYYNFTEEKIAVKDLMFRVEELYKNAQIGINDWLTIERHHYENADLELYIPDINDFTTIINDFFKIEKTVISDFDFCDLHPIFVCKPVNKTN